MTARVLVSRQVEESQRNAQEARNREQQRERERLNEKAKDNAIFAEKTAKLKAIRLAKEASARDEAISAAATKLTTPRKKTAAAK